MQPPAIRKKYKHEKKKKNRIDKGLSSAQVSSEGAGIFVPRWLLCAPLLANAVCSRVYRHLLRRWYRGIFYLRGSYGSQSPKGVQSVLRHRLLYYLMQSFFPFPNHYLDCRAFYFPKLKFSKFWKKVKVYFGLERPFGVMNNRKMFNRRMFFVLDGIVAY